MLETESLTCRDHIISLVRLKIGPQTKEGRSCSFPWASVELALLPGRVFLALLLACIPGHPLVVGRELR